MPKVKRVRYPLFYWDVECVEPYGSSVVCSCRYCGTVGLDEGTVTFVVDSAEFEDGMGSPEDFVAHVVFLAEAKNVDVSLSAMYRYIGRRHRETQGNYYYRYHVKMCVSECVECFTQMLKSSIRNLVVGLTNVAFLTAPEYLR